MQFRLAGVNNLYLKKSKAMEFEFSSDKRSDEEVVDSLIQLITINVTGKENIEDQSRNKLLFLIKQADSNTYETVSKFLEAFIVYSFLKSDKDLRLKGMNVWKEEKERHKIAYLDQLENIKMLFDEKGWDIGDLREELICV